MILASLCLGLSPTPPTVVQNFENLMDALFAEELASTGKPHAATPTEVVTDDGPLRVERVSASTSGHSWLRARGVQYAEHPVGALRWQPPVPHRRSSKREVLEAMSFGPDCVNAPLASRLGTIGTASTSEACLHLNVFAPDPVSELRPVFVWVHGGSFIFGGTTAYSGDWIMSTRRDVVIVTVNYRLGARACRSLNPCAPGPWP